MVSNLRRHFKVHQKQAVGSNRITPQKRARRVRQLIKKKPNNDRSVNDDQDPNLDSFDNITTPKDDTCKHHYLILPSMQNTTNTLHTHASANIAYQDIPITQAEPSLYYRIPQNWSKQENFADYHSGRITTLHQNQLTGSMNDVLSIFSTFGDFKFFY